MDERDLAWPFFEREHRTFARDLTLWLSGERAADEEDDAPGSVKRWVRALGSGGWLRSCVPQSYGGSERLDVRTLCLARETLAAHSALADFAFAMQGLGSGAISLFGNQAQRSAYVPRVASGDAIAAFALSEREAGSDVAALATTAVRDGGAYVIDGAKTWISNAGIADFYIVFARTSAAGSGA